MSSSTEEGIDTRETSTTGTTAIVTERASSADSDAEMPLSSNSAKPRSAFGVVVVACIAALQFGYNTAVMSGALQPVLQSFFPCSDDDDNNNSSYASYGSFSDSDSSHDDNCTTASSFMQGLLVSLILVGALVGALAGGPIADVIGRFWTLMIDEAVFVIGSLLCALAGGHPLFLFGRVVLGLAVGVASTVPSMFATEIAPLHQRGQVGVVNQAMICIGICLAYTVCSIFGLMDDKALAWRLMVGTPVVIALVHYVLMFIPAMRVESPRWLVLRGRQSQARDMLKKLRGRGFNESECQDLIATNTADAAAEEEGEEGRAKEEEDNGHGAFYEAFHPWRPIVIATGLMFWQQITGINAVLYYLSKFFMTAGMASDIAGYMSIVVGAVNIAMTFVSVPLIDRLGRKPLILISLSGMSVTLATIGFMGVFATSGSTAVGVANVIVTALFVVAFAVGMGCCPWAVINEIFNNKARGVAVSLSMATNWSINLLVTLLFPVLIEAMNMGYVFLGFAVLGVCAVVFVCLLLPETKGRSMEEIVKEFKK